MWSVTKRSELISFMSSKDKVDVKDMFLAHGSMLATIAGFQYIAFWLDEACGARYMCQDSLDGFLASKHTGKDRQLCTSSKA
jgi:hypothetical protein